MVSTKQQKKNEDEAHKVARLRVPVVYTAIKQEGEDELERPLSSLWWSGIAAGMSIFISVIAMGALYQQYGEKNFLVHIGYSMGFLVVILGRLQLFTENTIMAVIPLLANWDKKTLFSTVKLWVIVFLANLVGVFIIALASSRFGIIPNNIVDGMLSISKYYIDKTPLEFFLLGVPAGFIVASIAWMMPSARGGNEFWIIMVFTTLISLGGFTHVVAGSGEVFMIMFKGDISIYKAFFGSIFPTFAGNVLGGTLLFSVLAHAQVKEEI